MEQICKDFDCVVKLGGRRERARQSRHKARLTILGANAEEAFYSVLAASKRHVRDFDVKQVRDQNNK